MIGLILGIITITLVFYHFKNHYNKRGRLVNKFPGPTVLPLLGNAREFLGPLDELWKSLRRINKEYYPINRLWLGGLPTISVYHPDDVQIVLSSTKHTEKGRIYDFLHPWLGTGLLTSTGEKWLIRRRMMTPAFHFNILQEFVNVFVEQSELLVKKLKGEGNEIIKDIVPIMTRLTLDSICETAMGTELDAKKNEKEYRDAVQKLGDHFVYRLVRPWLHNSWIFNMSKTGIRQKKVLQTLHHLTNKIIADRVHYHEQKVGQIKHSNSSVNETGINLPGIAEYICGHNVLKAHASAYHLYNNEFRKKQKGTIGIVNMCNSYFAKNKDPKLEDDAFQFTCGWFSHPIFSKKGDYPPIMKKLIKEISLRKGWSKSTLPVFDKKWINYIKGSSDFYGLNHYSSEVVERKINNGSYIWAEFNASFTLDPKWKMANSLWLAVVPEGFRKILKKIKKEYGNIPIYITENGYSDDGELMDEKRVKFYFLYLKEMLKAIYKDGCNVQLYTAWSLLDNFEWNRGYKEKFGIIQVDFDKPSRNRTMKSSAIWFKSLLQHRKLSLNYN